MPLTLPAGDGPLDESWTRPLVVVAALVRDNPRYQFFDVTDFMIMCKVVRSGRADIIVYKNRHTRGSVHLDRNAVGYRYIPPRDGARGNGRYVVAKNVNEVLDDLGLWELPWLKPGLELYRFGRSWDDRWSLHPDVDPRHDWMTQEPTYFGPDPMDDWGPPPPPAELVAPVTGSSGARRPARRKRSNPGHLRLLDGPYADSVQRS